MNIRNTQKGFSLVEMLVYLSISSIILLTIFSLSINLIKYQNNIQANYNLNQQINSVMTEMSRIIHNAESIDSPSQGNIDNKIEITTGVSSLDPTIFYVVDDRILLDEDGDEYFLTNNTIKVASFNVENLSSDDAPETVRITIEAESSVGSELTDPRVSRTFISSFTLRHYE